MTAVTHLERTAELLGGVFHDPRLGDPRYLRWLYEESPFGPVIEANVDDDRGRAAHYAVVPIALAADGVPVSGCLSLNTAVHERARGGGVFVRLADATYRQARDKGIATVLGVANANSTPGFVRHLEFDLIGQLPARVVLPAPMRGGRAWETAWADELGPRDFAAAGPILGARAGGLARVWDGATLAWRLRAPAARYAVHRAPEALAVSAVERSGPVPVGVILKIFASTPLSLRMVRSLVNDVAKYHRTPAVIHVGLNDLAEARGIKLPGRLRPSPLNLIRRELTAPGEHSSPIGRFEFLDFDAY